MPNPPQLPPPQMAGAALLDKKPVISVEEKAAQLKGMVQRLMEESGLVCACGERLREGGVSLFVIAVRTQETPAGPTEVLQRITIPFHAPNCPALPKIVTEMSLLGVEVMVLCTTGQSNEWLVEPPMPEAPPAEPAAPAGDAGA